MPLGGPARQRPGGGARLPETKRKRRGGGGRVAARLGPQLAGLRGRGSRPERGGWAAPGRGERGRGVWLGGFPFFLFFNLFSITF